MVHCLSIKTNGTENVVNGQIRLRRKFPIRWAIGSSNKQNKILTQNCIFEKRAGRGKIPAQRWEKCRKQH